MIEPQAIVPPEPDSSLPADVAAAVLRVRLHLDQRMAWLTSLQKAESNNGDWPEDEWQWRADADSPARSTLSQAESELEGGRLQELMTLFSLSGEDRDLLHVCLTQALVPVLGTSFAWAQNDANRPFVTDQLVARLFDYGYFYPLHAESPLLKWGIVQESFTAEGLRRFAIDPQITAWLLGHTTLHPALVDVAVVQAVKSPLAHWPVATTVTDIQRILDGDSPLSALVEVNGTEGSGRRTFCATVSAALGFPLLVLHTSAIRPEHFRQVFVLAQRQAFLDKCALAWLGPWDMEALATTTWFPLQFVLSALPGANTTRSDVVSLEVSLGQPDHAQKRDMWRQFIPESASWSEAQRAMLAQRHVEIGDIVAVSQRGLQTFDELNQAVTGQHQQSLEGLATPLVGQFEREDLVAKQALVEQLDEVIFEAGDRDRFWSDSSATRLFPRGQGLVVLFSGPPGTGKTMAAQIVAGALGIPVYRVDLSAVVSKYVGETSQHLSTLMTKAALMDVVLLFDEADALFSKRTEVNDAHDRFANTDTNYLLQAIEDYPGVAILATNKKGNIDPAFLRRLRYVVEFQEPDVEQRYLLWKRMTEAFLGEVPVALAPALVALADQLKLTGAQIKYALLTAVMLARKQQVALSTTHLLKGVQRELNKEGRHFSTQEMLSLQQKVEGQS